MKKSSELRNGISVQPLAPLEAVRLIMRAVGVEMANTAADLPAELQNHHAKYRVIQYLRELQLPSRHRRKILMDWGAHHSVEITTEDYHAVTAPDVPNEAM